MNAFITKLTTTLAITTAGVCFASAPELPELDQAALALMGEQEQSYYLWEQEFLTSLNYQDGLIQLPGGFAQLTVPESFYYLSPEDAEKVLVEGWGNMPSETLGLGMLFPAQYHPMANEAWGVTIDFEADGYVSDEDAHKIDYQDVLAEMKSDTQAASEWRLENGYESIELLGWAADPYYDSAGKKLHWAKELRFGESVDTTLNYNVRILGRKGVLVLNFIASMPQLAEIEQTLPQVMTMPEFVAGHTYADFDPSYDKVAAYGIGGLVAGKVLAKTGILATLLIFAKKFGAIIVVGLAAIGRKLFGKKKAS